MRPTNWERPYLMTEPLKGDGPAGTAGTIPDAVTNDEPAPQRASPPITGQAGTRSYAGAALLVTAFAVYAVINLWAFWPIWPGDPHQIAGLGGDPSRAVWFLKWTSFAIIHGHNPWLTNYLEYPRGVNLGQNTSMPLLGLLGLPVTAAFGPISAFNTMMWLSFPVSATACFVLLRRWVSWAPAAFVGGLLYGFSPYMVSHGLGHLNLIFVPFPPLVLLLLDELLVRQRRGALTMGMLLGLVLALQFLVSSEVLGSTIVIAVAGVVVLALCRPRQLLGHARHALPGLLAGAVVLGLLIAYPAWVQVAGPGVFSGGAQHGFPYPADVLGTVTPTKLQFLAPSRLAAISRTFTAGGVVENGSYLGIPLLLASLGVLIWRWRMSLVRFAAAMAIIATVISWGPWLEFKGVEHTRIPLPVALVNHLPLFKNFLYARFALYADLFVAVLLAIGIDQWRHAWQRIRARRPQSRPRGRSTLSWWRPAALVGVLAVLLVPIVPAWPYTAYPTAVPAFFTTSVVRRIPAGSVVLTYPYAADTSPDGMLWQAVAGMRFKLMGGSALTRAPTGTSTYNAFPPTDATVPATLTADFTGQPLVTILPGAVTATPVQVRQFLRYYDVGTIVFRPGGARPDRALSLIESALGPPLASGGVDVWFSVQSRVPAS